MNNSIPPSDFLASYLGAKFNPYGSIGSLQAPYELAGNPFGPGFRVKGTSPNTGKQPLMPGEPEDVRKVYKNKFSGDAIDIGPGFAGLQLPPV